MKPEGVLLWSMGLASSWNKSSSSSSLRLAWLYPLMVALVVRREFGGRIARVLAVAHLGMYGRVLGYILSRLGVEYYKQSVVNRPF